MLECARDFYHIEIMDLNIVLESESLSLRMTQFDGNH